MHIGESSLAGAPLLRPQGEIDHSNAQELRDLVERYLLAGPPVLGLDLSCVPYLDSAGISVLLGLVRDLQPRGLVCVIGASSNVLRLLEIVGMFTEPSFLTFETEEQAAAELEQRNLVGFG